MIEDYAIIFLMCLNALLTAHTLRQNAVNRTKAHEAWKEIKSFHDKTVQQNIEMRQTHKEIVELVDKFTKQQMLEKRLFQYLP